MTQINPFAGSVAQSPQVQRTQAAEKDQQVRKSQDRGKDAGLAGGDTFEHQVESTDAPQPIHDEDERHQDPRRQRRPSHGTQSPPDSAEESDDHDSPPPQLDLTA
jgi:hypothetical protein